MAYNKMLKYFDLDTTLTFNSIPNGIIASAISSYGTPNIPMGQSHYITFVGIPVDANLADAIVIQAHEATAIDAGTKATAIGSISWIAGTSEAGTIKVLEISAEELDVANGYDHITVKLITSGADSVAVHAIRGPNRYDPASLID